MEEEGGARGNPFEVLPEELSVRILRELSADALVNASAEWQDALALYKEQSEKAWKQIYVESSTTVLTADMMAQLNAWLSGYRTWKLIYRGFHKHCDKKGPTVTVCKTEKGYSRIPSIVERSSPPTATPTVGDVPFIFSLKNPKGVEPCFMQHKGSGTGVINNANYGPTWGAEAKQDLGVFGYPHNKGRWSWSRLGSFYSSTALRQALTKEEDWHCFLAGEPHFLVGEVEVFAIDREHPHLRREKELAAPPERKRSVFASMVHRLRGSKRTGAKE
ncbi:uncharacterized protein ACA1_062280 [Acanthamoeba castellanii str. Neff]|uniref:Uncharacterized protein n=1 Tax=Acanthamoeba castellanii (strain ATCC 30010 / Neff) TaxID=1257118 RepID=L8GZF1_ACACF|nr:uncharacterized protein ACA1_062280 [Acanthamoeba castellanii str. Neff]ELR17486.1 hypothetical protein ACA1_062280 [Acanthamoeba castellanii str. Neff]